MELHAATDITDEIHTYGEYYTREQVDEIMKHLARLGVKRVEWITGAINSNLYEDYPGGFDLLAHAVNAAHLSGMELHAVIKPFEAPNSLHLPHAYPQPKDAIFWKDLRGIQSVINPFVTAHPEMCFARRPGNTDPGGDISKIHVVKGDDRALPFSLDDLSIWIGNEVGDFKPYTGPVKIREFTEWRPFFPWEREARIIELSGLKIPANHPVVEIRVPQNEAGGFATEIDSVLECFDSRGDAIPITMGSTSAYGEPHQGAITELHARSIRYFKHPAVKAFLKNNDVTELWQNMRNFDCRQNTVIVDDLVKRGRVTAIRGKNPHIPILNPIYPEVRAYWLELADFCLSRGVDGIDMRPSSHFRCNDMHNYGFNDLVIEATGGSLNRSEVGRINGEAYTKLLRECRELVHERGKAFGLHVTTNMLQEDDDQGKTSNLPSNITWEYPTWIRELADYVVFRGAMGMQRHKLDAIVDHFSALTHAAQIPFIYQSNRRHVNYNQPLHALREEMSWVTRHPYVDAYQLYESNSMIQIDGTEKTRTSPQITQLVSEYEDAFNDHIRA